MTSLSYANHMAPRHSRDASPPPSPPTTPSASASASAAASAAASASAPAPLPSSRLDADAAWAAVLGRDGRQDGLFVYAVETTGVYCRPSCPSRRPLRRNASFFDTVDAAERAGYRACRRCRPQDVAAPAVALVERVRTFIDTHLDDRLTLGKLARHAGLSPFHLQRTFKRTTGLTPAQYAAARRAERFRGELKSGANVTRATYDAGYGSSSRLYAVSNAQLGMTPGTYRRGGRGLNIRYATTASPFGRLLVAATERGICAVQLGDDDRTLESALEAEYPRATRERAPEALTPWIDAVLARLEGQPPKTAVPLDVQATDFKWRVWRALQEIPYGQTRTYGDVAAAIGAPRAVRAVANACATNQAAILIPCHRVIGANGALTGYRWGVDRKRQLLAHERTRAEKAR